MRLKLDGPLLDPDDAVITEDGQPVPAVKLLKRVIISDKDAKGEPVKPEDKLDRFELFLKLKSWDAETDFSPSEVALLDKAVLAYPPLIAGQLHYLLSQK